MNFASERLTRKNMDYKGTIIEESLKNPGVLLRIKILETRVEETTPEHQTPWLSQWTLHTVEIQESEADAVAEQLRRNIETSHSTWYIDYKNPQRHYIIFPEKTFVVDRARPEEYKEATAYGISLGIPEHQLDFSPDIG